MLHTSHCQANSVWAVWFHCTDVFTGGTRLQGRPETSARPGQANNLVPLQTDNL